MNWARWGAAWGNAWARAWGYVVDLVTGRFARPGELVVAVAESPATATPGPKAVAVEGDTEALVSLSPDVVEARANALAQCRVTTPLVGVTAS